MSLIAFVKLLPKYRKVRILVNNDSLDLDIKTLAEHQHDTVTGIDVVGECFVITVSAALTVPNPYLSSCDCRS